MINFHTWSAPANHAMKSDIILQKLQFPNRVDDDMIMHNHAMLLKGAPFDIDEPKDVQLMEHLNDLLYGTEDDNGDIITRGVYREIMAMVDETCTIVQTVTEKGSETFGLPKLSEQPEGLDIRRRDRYSALLLAAHAARQVMGHGHERSTHAYGGSPNMVLGNSNAQSINRRNSYPIRRKGGVVY